MKNIFYANLVHNDKPLTGLVMSIFITVASMSMISCGQNDSSLTEQSESQSNSHNSQALNSKALNSKDSINRHAKLFSGCYKVTQDAPAQIKISLNNDRLVMQMKEAESTNRVWDDPETMDVMSLNDTDQFFPVDSKHINGMIGRPDRKMVLASVKKAYANLNPLLDSDFLVFILQDSNTIYKVDCDDIHIDFENRQSKSDTSTTANSSSSSASGSELGTITIKQIGKVETTQE